MKNETFGIPLLDKWWNSTSPEQRAASAGIARLIGGILLRVLIIIGFGMGVILYFIFTVLVNGSKTKS